MGAPPSGADEPETTSTTLQQLHYWYVTSGLAALGTHQEPGSTPSRQESAQGRDCGSGGRACASRLRVVSVEHQALHSAAARSTVSAMTRILLSQTAATSPTCWRRPPPPPAWPSCQRPSPASSGHPKRSFHRGSSFSSSRRLGCEETPDSLPHPLTKPSARDAAAAQSEGPGERRAAPRGRRLPEKEPGGECLPTSCPPTLCAGLRWGWRPASQAALAQQGGCGRRAGGGGQGRRRRRPQDAHAAAASTRRGRGRSSRRLQRGERPGRVSVLYPGA